MLVRRWLSSSCCCRPPRFAPAGALVVVGGGGTGPDIVAKALALAGGKNAIVAVLPQSSAEPDAGDDSVKMWLDAGAREAAKVAFDDPSAAAALRRATLIWMPGGDQNRFMKAIEGTGLADVIRERHGRASTVGGTSAGAAVIAEAMFTGDADLKSLTAGATVIGEGAGPVARGADRSALPQAAARQPADQRRDGSSGARRRRHRRRHRGHRPGTSRSK